MKAEKRFEQWMRSTGTAKSYSDAFKAGWAARDAEIERLRELSRTLYGELRQRAIHWHNDGQVFRCGICYGKAETSPRRPSTITHTPDCILAVSEKENL